MKRHLLYFLLCAIGTFFIRYDGYAQSLQRSHIGTMGGSSTDAGPYLHFTVGQSVQAGSVSNMLHIGYESSSDLSETLKALERKVSLIAFPNPGSRDITLRSNTFINSGTLEVFDMKGKLIIEKDIINQAEINLFVEDWEQGIYQARILTTDQSSPYYTKFIKK